MNIAIVLAAGQSRRFDANVPKQFMAIDGRQILAFSTKTFLDHPAVDGVIIVVSPGEVERVTADYPQCRVIAGGANRQESASLGVAAAPEGTKNVLVHDAARPFVTAAIIAQSIDAMETHDGAAPYRPMTDSLVHIGTEGPGHIDRETIRAVQTPQTFRIEVLREAQAAGQTATDEVGLVYQVNPAADVHFFEGDSFNFKITTRMDFYVAEHLMRSQVYLNEAVFDASGKRALVLGGTGGIGGAIAKRLQAFGADVTIAGSEIRVQEPDSLQPFTSREWDVIVHSMGTMRVGAKSIIELIENLSYGDWDEGMKVNLTSAFLTAKLALETMPQGGHLLFIGSSSARRGRKTYGLYSAAKAGLQNLVQSLSEELEPRGIMVNCINPSRTFTKMRSVFTGEDPTRMVQPDRVAEIATGYCHGRVTGQVFDLRVGE